MNILVCIKQVPENETEFVINAQKNWIEESEGISYRINRYDEYALEEALRIKEAFQNVKISVLSIGPLRVEDALKRAISLGADTGIHLICDQYTYLSAYDIASYIAEYARSNSYDLIFTGVMAEDDMQCLVGSMTSAILDIPCAVSVTQTSLKPDENKIIVTCELDGGLSETVVLTLPALLTIQSGINRPRYPSLSNIIRSRSQKILTIPVEEICKTNKREDNINIKFPEIYSSCSIIKGSAEKKAEQLLIILKKFLK
ncbi:MAG: electron transfer flavoprotein subunit beta/FixA family protein [Desulfobacterales bacterium]|nr:electron transfer flavoprotein subunit beta/FixA family protein [Desulfobacterales bacterium]MBF0395592.1 electron transfer flavoprotein subunit beta/FixA family protein [Desulfobacterales bacterium]